jgi:hypothetical protein
MKSIVTPSMLHLLSFFTPVVYLVCSVDVDVKQNKKIQRQLQQDAKIQYYEVFQRAMSPPSSKLKSRPSKETKQTRQQAKFF